MIKVLIWNEFKHERKSETVKAIYPDGMHKTIGEALKCDDIEVRYATLEDENCGITDEILADTDVIVWWGHMAHNEVPDEIAKKVQNAVLSGMGAIFLHSAHHSKPFRLLMGTTCNLSWREDGDMERVWVVKPSHPIVQGIGRYFELPHEETYAEPFDIPEPEETILIGSYEGSEVFRSGVTYKRGNGKIFYFQPGHETFPTFHDENVKTIIKNAVYWVKSDYRKAIPCPKITKIEK